GAQPELHVSESRRRRAASGPTGAHPRVLSSGDGIGLESYREAHIVGARMAMRAMELESRPGDEDAARDETVTRAVHRDVEGSGAHEGNGPGDRRLAVGVLMGLVRRMIELPDGEIRCGVECRVAIQWADPDRWLRSEVRRPRPSRNEATATSPF